MPHVACHPLSGRSFVRRPTARRGAVTIEALVVIPLLVILTFGAFQLAGALAIEQAVSYAATVGVRETGKGAMSAEIQTTIERALAPYQVVMGPKASFIVEQFGAANVQVGTLPCSTPANPATVATGEVRVTVCVELSVAPFASMLSSVGLDFSTRRFTASSLVRSET